MREKLLEFLFNQSADSILIMDPSGPEPIIVDCNDVTGTMHGYLRQELIGKPISFLNTEEDRIHVADRMANLVRKRWHLFEVQHKRKDGKVLDLSVNASLVDLDGKTHLLAIHRDITEHKKAEMTRAELQKQIFHSTKLASIGRMASGIAHEINNPLMIIQCHLEVVEKKLASKSSDIKGELDVIFSFVEKIAEIVKGLQTYARMDSPQFGRVDVNWIISTTVELVQGMFSKKGAAIEKRLVGKHAFVKGNTGKFQQLVMNLLANARDAVAGKAGRIIVGTEDGDGEVIVTVTDNGCGIAKQDLEKIFDPFFTTKAPGEGTGLGLSIVHSIVEEMKGRITVESELDEGTTVTLRFPVMREVQTSLK